MSSYYKKVTNQLNDALANLRGKGVDVDQYVFDGPTPAPDRIVAPSFADSKFQQEQAFGDWAENSLANAINTTANRFRAVHYGFSSKSIAGDEGFKAEYQAGILDTCRWGKRADLLLVPAETDTETDISNISTEDLKGVVAASLGAVEVRSSRMESLRHAAYVTQQTAIGKKVATPELNFTVKVEDLAKVLRWIQVFDRPQAYAQVLLDTVHVIGVSEIINFIASEKKIQLMNPKRSGKETICVPFSAGKQAGIVVEYPELTAMDRIAKNGRHDWFIKPSGGRIEVDMNILVESLSQ